MCHKKIAIVTLELLTAFFANSENFHCFSSSLEGLDACAREFRDRAVKAAA